MKTAYNNIVKRLEMIEAEKECLTKDLENLNKELAKSVKSTKTGKTTTLIIGKRVVKAAELSGCIKGYKITEGDKIVQKEYRGSIYDLKITLALGCKKIGPF